MRFYPAVLDVDRPEKLDRAQVVLRFVVLLILGSIGWPLGGIVGLLYLALPVAAALMIAQRGPEGYIRDMAPRMIAALRWIIAAFAYLGLLTDRLPGSSRGREVDSAVVEPPLEPFEPVRFEVHPEGAPTVGSALMRLILSIPEALGLCVLGIAAGFVWLISAVMVLFTGSYPRSLHAFLRGTLRWMARMFAYHASLVEHRPPFALETGRSTV